LLAGFALKGIALQDVLFVAATIFFFAVAVLYIRGCERLK